MYRAGQGVIRDNKEAAKWFRKAAEQGDADAKTLLAMMYYAGHGVDKDIDKAIELYQQAARQGDVTAKEILKHLGKSW